MVVASTEYNAEMSLRGFTDLFVSPTGRLRRVEALERELASPADAQASEDAKRRLCDEFRRWPGLSLVTMAAPLDAALVQYCRLERVFKLMRKYVLGDNVPEEFDRLEAELQALIQMLSSNRNLVGGLTVENAREFSNRADPFTRDFNAFRRLLEAAGAVLDETEAP